MDRRNFFSSIQNRVSNSNPIPIYIPYLKSVSSLKKCTTCKKPCIDVCEERIIVEQNGIPTIDFKKSGCTFCKKCAIQCGDFGVLDSNINPTINAKISIKTSKCLAWNDTMCFTCKDSCIKNAISYFGIFRPTINDSVCTKCGMCISVCPANAIAAISVSFKELL